MKTELQLNEKQTEKKHRSTKSEIDRAFDNVLKNLDKRIKKKVTREEVIEIIDRVSKKYNTSLSQTIIEMRNNDRH